ncbi:DnaJ- protein scj1 [Irineochytrium annulatum]|nr:DnaJ- protein scj1 [Irineochytrium annulatum]
MDLKQSATPKEIKTQFYQLSLKYHPDKNPGSAEAHEKFIDINEAYSTLSNARSRREYDDTLDFNNRHSPSSSSSTSSNMGTGFGNAGGNSGRYRPPFRRRSDITPEDWILFRRGNTTGARGAPPPGFRRGGTVFDYEMHQEEHYGNRPGSSMGMGVGMGMGRKPGRDDPLTAYFRAKLAHERMQPRTAIILVVFGMGSFLLMQSKITIHPSDLIPAAAPSHLAPRATALSSINLHPLYALTLLKNPYPAVDVTTLIIELHRFLLLKSLAADPARMGPTGAIDEIWHDLMCMPSLYRDVCAALVGVDGVIDHCPLAAFDGTEVRRGRMRATVEAYRAVFGEPRGEVWAEALEAAVEDRLTVTPGDMAEEPSKVAGADDDMVIYVKTLSGRPTPCVHVSSRDTIERVKEKIRIVMDIPAEQQRLIFGGKLLEDGRTIEECGKNVEEGYWKLPLRTATSKPSASGSVLVVERGATSVCLGL